MTDNAKAIKRRRAIRSALAALLATPPFAMFFLDPPPFNGTYSTGWPLEWQATFVVCMGLSLYLGWEPAKASWTGKDSEMYVDEPEIDDDW